MTSLTDNILAVTLYIFFLGTSVYLLGYGIYAGLIKKRIMSSQNQTSWTRGTAIGIGLGCITAGVLGLYACQYYWEGIRESLKALFGS